MKHISSVRAKVLYILGALLLIVVLQLLFSFSATFRTLYIHTFYPRLAFLLRASTGWFPFSIGDLLYVVAGIWVVLGLISFIKVIVKYKGYPGRWIHKILKGTGVLLTIYFIFLLFWGMNYRYDRVSADFKISQQYAVKNVELISLCDSLVQSLNTLHREITHSDTLPVAQKNDFIALKKKAFRSYRLAGYQHPFLKNYPKSVKPSMFGQLMNYSGVTGYYNPFTGEAQVNTTPPKVEIPFTICHEMAHQIGFAAEEDANFVGYFVAARSPYPLFRYSAHFSLFLYALNRLSLTRRAQADSLWNTALTKGVRKDFKNYLMFFQNYNTSFRQMSNRAYDQYLKANQQQKGIKSYRGIIALVLDYRRKYGRLP